MRHFSHYLSVVFYRYLETLVDTKISELKNWKFGINIELTIGTGEQAVLVDKCIMNHIFQVVKSAIDH